MDELLLAVYKDTPLFMEEGLGFHLYASDLILSAQQLGLCAVVVDAPVYHNTQLDLNTSSISYWEKLAESCDCFEKKWSHLFPYQTPSFLFLPQISLAKQLRRNINRAGQGMDALRDLALADGSLCPYPQGLNVGSGGHNLVDYLNIDLNPACQPDLVLDFGLQLHLPLKVSTHRFGDFWLQKGTFEEILAYGVLEQIKDLLVAMTNFLELLAVDGILKIRVAYDLSYGAWQNPNNIRAFNEFTLLYYIDNYQQIGWHTARFELLALTFNLSESGRQLQNLGMTHETLLRQPRAIDSLEVVMKKNQNQNPGG